MAALPEQESANLVERIDKKSDENDIIELSTGVQLRLKGTINPSILMDILAEVESKRPEPPEVWVESLGREEVNADDPDYISKYERWETMSSVRISDALILKGTEAGYIPDDIEGPDGNEWIEELEVLGFTLNRRSKVARYLAWVKHVAMDDVNDWSEVTGKLGRIAGVSESDVKLAQSAFPGKNAK